MNQTVENAVLRVQIGGSGFVARLAPGDLEYLEGMDAEGRITILKRHAESQSGQRRIDRVQFQRNR